MMSSWLGWRSTMVCAGWPSSQRNNPGAVTQTLPVATSGWDSTLSDRVWVKSADQLCRLVCAANQRLNWTSRSSARASIAVRNNAAMVQVARMEYGRWKMEGCPCRFAERNGATCPLARWERIDTIDQYPVES